MSFNQKGKIFWNRFFNFGSWQPKLVDDVVVLYDTDLQNQSTADSAIGFYNILVLCISRQLLSNVQYIFLTREH